MRTRIFVSYSHADRDWMDRLKLHLALLERRKLVDVWSDTRIVVGQNWEEEIEAALTAAKVAVLLVSPAFLASDYIWNKEMPHILAHEKAGMRLLPFVARPCAWKLAGELARLQARPADGRPLSTGSDAQIDLDLTAFVYELAGLLGELPEGVASDEWERTTRTESGASATGTFAPAAEPSSSDQTQIVLPPVWRGRYGQADARITLRLDQQNGDGFAGLLEYDGDGTVTEVRGRVRRKARALQDDPAWRGIGDAADLAVVFREIRVVQQGRRPVSFDGEYRAFVDGRLMNGGWFSATRLVGTFTLRADGR